MNLKTIEMNERSQTKEELLLFSQSHVWLFCDPRDCSPPGSSVHGISQARILEWVTILFSKRSSQPRNQTWVSCIGRCLLYHWATREAPKNTYYIFPLLGILASANSCFSFLLDLVWEFQHSEGKNSWKAIWIWCWERLINGADTSGQKLECGLRSSPWKEGKNFQETRTKGKGKRWRRERKLEHHFPNDSELLVGSLEIKTGHRMELVGMENLGTVAQKVYRELTRGEKTKQAWQHLKSTRMIFCGTHPQ